MAGYRPITDKLAAQLCSIKLLWHRRLCLPFMSMPLPVCKDISKLRSVSDPFAVTT